MKPVDPLTFIFRFSRKKIGKAFSPEEVTLKAGRYGVRMRDARSWGPYFKQAAKEGYIKRSTELFSRTTSNGSVRPGWEGV